MKKLEGVVESLTRLKLSILAIPMWSGESHRDDTSIMIHFTKVLGIYKPEQAGIYLAG